MRQPSVLTAPNRPKTKTLPKGKIDAKVHEVAKKRKAKLKAKPPY